MRQKTCPRIPRDPGTYGKGRKPHLPRGLPVHGKVVSSASLGAPLCPPAGSQENSLDEQVWSRAFSLIE